MDFGFGSLVDKFDERFGKRITTGLLAVVGLAILGGGVKLIYETLIKPGIDLFNSTDWPDFKAWMIERLLPTLLSLGVIFVLSIMLSQVVTEVYRRTIGRMLLRKRADEHIKRSLAEYKERITKKVSEISKGAETEAIASMSAMRDRLMSELHETMKTRDDAIALTQTILDTVGPWLAEVDEGKPEESIEKSKELIRALKGLKESGNLTDKGSAES